MRALHLVAGLALAVALVGCSDDGGGGKDEDSTGGSAVTAASVGERIHSAVGGSQMVEITEDNDPNELLGRPNGYVAAVVLKDPRIDDCGSDLGVDCGATIEEWPDAKAAKKRADYISDLQEDSPMLGSEYHYLDGPVLVRVSGDLKPSEAEEYEAALR